MPANGEQRTEYPAEPPMVCMYLFLDAAGRTLPPHPSPRTASPLRYLECAVVQAASLRLGGASCEILLVTNLDGSRGLGRAGGRMWSALGELGVERLALPLRIEPGTDPLATRLPRETIRAAVSGSRGERVLWLPNLDCVWVRPGRALQGAPRSGSVGALAIPYPPDWRVGGPESIGATRAELGRTAVTLGSRPGTAPRWIGADLLAGTAASLAATAGACDELDEHFARSGVTATNEQLLTLAAALGRVEIEDLSALARRIQTGARHAAGAPADVAQLGIWHLPAEKGLALRRAGRAVARGRTGSMRADLASPTRAMGRFNVGSARRVHQLRDDAWVALGTLTGSHRRRTAATLLASDRAVAGRME